MAIVIRADRQSPLQKTNVVYQDFLPQALFNNFTSDVNLVKNEDSVKQAILNLMQTRVGEKPFNPNYGSEINKLLFENFTPQTTAVLIDLIKSAIDNFEPRARLIDVVASPREEENAYAISIIFSVINKTEPVTLEFLLNRTR
jgi:phage baseplate assembly protein W